MESDDFEYETSVEGHLAIIRAMDEMTFLERMELLMVMVAQRLVEAGVDFSKVDWEKWGKPKQHGVEF